MYYCHKNSNANNFSNIFPNFPVEPGFYCKRYFKKEWKFYGFLSNRSVFFM